MYLPRQMILSTSDGLGTDDGAYSTAARNARPSLSSALSASSGLYRLVIALPRRRGTSRVRDSNSARGSVFFFCCCHELVDPVFEYPDRVG